MLDSEQVAEEIYRAGRHLIDTDQLDHQFSGKILLNDPYILVAIDSKPTAIGINPMKVVIRILIRPMSQQYQDVNFASIRESFKIR